MMKSHTEASWSAEVGGTTAGRRLKIFNFFPISRGKNTKKGFGCEEI
jgi:hypothetical protein